MNAAPRKNSVAKAASKQAKPRISSSDVLEINFSLAELPSAQHRAGLAGMVMMTRWVEKQPGREKGTCAISHLDAGGATLSVDRDGLQRLLDAAYAADEEEIAAPQPWKQRGEPVEPIRVEEREATDDKGTKKKKYYIYPVVVPRGGFLRSYEPQTESGATPWLKLWRDMLWETLRGVPATRAPFEARARKQATPDSEALWAELSDPKNRSVDLPSTYYIGAQAVTAENVRFRDRARQQFLLHFWPYAAQIYVPSIPKATDGKTEFVGYAVAVPDVAVLDAFCEDLPELLKTRETDMAAFRPRAALVDLPAEGALDMARRLRERIITREGARTTADLVLGFEVFHLSKEGNNVRLLSASRIEPEARIVDEYVQLRGLRLWDATFRRVRLLNLLDRRPWYTGFDRVIATLPYDRLTIGSTAFRHDAWISFEREREQSEASMSEEDRHQSTPVSLEEVVHSLAYTYVREKMKSKHGIEWNDVKDDAKKREEYNERKRKIAKDAFLAVRSRTDAAFVDYFAGTLCSVSQFLPRERFNLLTRALREENDREHVRTLTLLALSAVSY